MTETKKKIQVNPLAIIIFALLGVYLLTMVATLGWTLITTMKSNNEYEYFEVAGEMVGNKLWLPKEGWSFDNYVNAYNYFYVEVDAGEGYYTKFDIFMQLLHQ